MVICISIKKDLDEIHRYVTIGGQSRNSQRLFIRLSDFSYKETPRNNENTDLDRRNVEPSNEKL